MRIRYEGAPGFGVTAKDLILGTIGQMGVGGATGHVVEYAGPAIEALSMEGRMTVCNMTIEGGGRAGMIAPDDTTFAWFEQARPGAPAGRRAGRGDRALARAAHRRGRELRPRDGRRRRRALAAGHLGHEPRAWCVPSPSACPRPRSSTAPPTARPPSARSTTWTSSPARRSRRSRSTACSSARARTRASATCARPPRSSRGRKVAASVEAMVVPGSQQVKAQAEAEGLDEVFRDAGFDWRVAGCSMCLGMNPDILAPGERCASTSNRNFEGRQGRGGTHAPRLPADGRRGGHRGALRRHPRLELGATWNRSRSSPARSATWTAPTSTPTRSCPSSSSSASSAPASASSCSTTGPRSPAGICPPTRSSSPARTSAAAPRASTRRGGCRTTASGRSSRRASRDIFYSNCTKIGLLPVVLARRTARRSRTRARARST